MEDSRTFSPGNEASPDIAKVGQVISALVPDHAACREALSVAHASLPASIFNHSLRVFLYAKAFAAKQEDALEELSPIAAMPIKPQVLFVA